MSTKIKEIIGIIESECPGYSKSDIQNAILKYLETNIEEITSNVKLPEKSPTSFSHKVKGFRQEIQKRKLHIDSSKQELISGLESIREHLEENHKYDAADIITQDIADIDMSSSTYRAHLLNIDTHIARTTHDLEEEYDKDNKTLKQLGDLTDDSK